MVNRLEDGSDLDIDQYVRHYVDLRTGEAGEPRLFRHLLPCDRDVSTALLLDGSSSLGYTGTGVPARAGLRGCVVPRNDSRA